MSHKPVNTSYQDKQERQQEARVRVDAQMDKLRKLANK